MQTTVPLPVAASPEAAPGARSVSKLGAFPWLLSAVVVLFLATIAGRSGWFRDELYYLASIEHLGWGYVDHPPASIALLATWTAVFGESLLAVRLLPALLVGGLILATARLARELGGDRRAAALAAAATASAPIVLHMGSFYSMNALDLVLWTAAAMVVARIARTEDPRGWIAFGAIAGVGVLNKISMGFLAVGVALAVLLTPLRRHLRTKEIWLGAGISGLLFAPHVLWQVRHGWPTPEFMAVAMRDKIVALDPLAKLGEVALLAQPTAAPLAVLGLLWSLARPGSRRWLGVAASAVGLFLLVQKTKPYYLSPLLPLLFAAGSVCLAELTRERRRATPGLVAGLLLLGGAALSPTVVPVLAPDDFLAYQARLGLTSSSSENHVRGALPQHFADRFGWPEMARSVAAAWESLPREERATTLIVTSNYGEAGALRLFGPALGLPDAVSQHNSFYLWGPGRDLGEITTVLGVGLDPDGLRTAFADVRPAGSIDHPWAMPYETGEILWWARQPTMDLADAWEAGRHYD